MDKYQRLATANLTIDQLTAAGLRHTRHLAQSSVLPLQPLLQYDGIVVLFVARRIKQGNRTTSQPVEQFPCRCFRHPALQFDEIGSAKRVPIIRLAVKALTQRVARRDVLEPQVNPRLILGNAARPKAVNQYACPVARVRRLVNALEHKRGHFVLPNVMMVEVPCANTLPSLLSTLASAEMIWRPWATTRASARTRAESSVIGRAKFALVSIVV